MVTLSISHFSVTVNSPGSSPQPIPVVAVSPQPKVQKSHIDDFAGVSIIPTSAPQDYESKIDCSKATITPQPINKSGKFRKVMSIEQKTIRHSCFITCCHEILAHYLV